MQDTFLEASHIVKRFTAHTALNDVSISVPRGKVFGLLGPNGAGKTTLIRIINHITAPDSGTVTFDGHPLCEEDMLRIGYLPEERGLYKRWKWANRPFTWHASKDSAKARQKNASRIGSKSSK